MDGKLDLIEILREELRRHPNAEPIDLRKLIMLSVYGGDHLFENPTGFPRGLKSEWERLPDGLNMSPTQLIDPTGRTARIHLAGCRSLGIHVEELATLLLSQPRKGGQAAGDVARWRAVVALAADGRIPFDPTELADLERLEDLPHHSKAYGSASYRILNDIGDPAVAAKLRSWKLRP